MLVRSLHRLLISPSLRITNVNWKSVSLNPSSCNYFASNLLHFSNQSSLCQNRFCSSSSSQKENKPLWDDSDWMNYNDSNAEAYAELDITKLRPFPEYRNVSVGPVWGPNAHQLVWGPYFEKQSPQVVARKQNLLWKKFTNDNGFEPDEYFESPDFKERYGERLIWEDYRRNHKGSRPVQRTRKKCKRVGRIRTGNPCPICRDSKLLVTYRNLVLLRHFIDPYSGNLHHNLRTGVCINRQRKLEQAVWLSRELGLLPKPMPPAFKQRLESYRIDHLAVRPIIPCANSQE